MTEPTGSSITTSPGKQVVSIVYKVSNFLTSSTIGLISSADFLPLIFSPTFSVDSYDIIINYKRPQISRFV